MQGRLARSVLNRSPWPFETLSQRPGRGIIIQAIRSLYSIYAIEKHKAIGLYGEVHRLLRLSKISQNSELMDSTLLVARNTPTKQLTWTNTGPNIDHVSLRTMW